MKFRVSAAFAAFLFILFGGMGHVNFRPFTFDVETLAGATVKESSPNVRNVEADEPGRPRPGDPPVSSVAILNKQLNVPAGIRLIVFSPHPDDESLAASGLIQRVRETQGKVRVVFMTNGDGYKEGVRRRLMRTETTSSDFLEYGKIRHDEAVQAVCQLGLQPEDAVFLGFPDAGIDDLWTDYWSRLKPYTSPFTRFDSPPYKECFSQVVKYAGVDLSNEIARVIEDFAPDWVLMPDPRDQHPDHYTTGVFVLDALRKLNQEGAISFANTRILTYLVHYLDYPEARTWIKQVNRTGVGGTPFIESILAETEWLNLPLTPQELEGKWHAIEAHQSQFSMLGDFFKRFLRPPYELFGEMDAAQALAIPQVYAAALKRRNS